MSSALLNGVIMGNPTFSVTSDGRTNAELKSSPGTLQCPTHRSVLDTQAFLTLPGVESCLKTVKVVVFI